MEEPKKLTGALILLFGAVLGAAITGASGYITTKMSDQKRLEASLVTEAMKAQSAKQRIDALNFYTKLKLIKDDDIDKGVQKFLTDPNNYEIPSLVLPPNSGVEVKRSAVYGGELEPGLWEWAFWVKETIKGASSALYLVVACNKENNNCRFITYADCKIQRNATSGFCNSGGINAGGMGKIGFTSETSTNEVSTRVDFNISIPINKKEEEFRVWRFN